MPLFTEVDGCLWSPERRLPKCGRKERKLVVWACPSCHFIFCQKSPRFTRQTLDRGHILGFLDLHGRPDVSMPPPPPHCPKPARHQLLSASAVHPPSPTHSSYPCCLPPTPPLLCPWELSNYSPPLPRLPPHPCSLFHYHSMCLHERHSFSDSAAITVIHVYDPRR